MPLDEYDSNVLVKSQMYLKVEEEKIWSFKSPSNEHSPLNPQQLDLAELEVLV